LISRRLGWCLVGILSLALCLLGGGGVYGFFTERGSRQLWLGACYLAGGRLQGEWIEGTWAKGIKLRRIHYVQSKTRVQLEALEGAWNVSIFPMKVTIPYLHLGTLRMAYAPSTSKSVPSLPKTLTFPFAVEARDIALNRLVLWSGHNETKLESIQLALQTDGRYHQLQLKQLNAAYVSVTSDLKLDGRAPFKLEGHASLRGHYAINSQDSESYQANIQIAETLERPILQGLISGRRVQGSVTVLATPFSLVPFERAHVAIWHLNPKQLWPFLPQADLDVQAALTPETVQGKSSLVSGSIVVKNASSGLIDKGQLPIQSLEASLELDDQSQRLKSLRCQVLGKGEVEGSGEWFPARQKGKAMPVSAQKGDVRFHLSDIDASAVYSGLKASQLQGTIEAHYKEPFQQFQFDLTDRQARFKSTVEVDAQWISLKQLHLSMGAAQSTGSIELEGKVAKAVPNRYAFKGSLVHVNPAIWNQWIATKTASKRLSNLIQAGDVSAHLVVDGVMHPSWHSKIQLTVDPSTYNQMPMTGEGSLELAPQQLLPSQLHLLVAGNQLGLEGSFGRPNDRMNIHVHAPALERLGFGLKGSMDLESQWSGGLEHPVIQAQYQANHLLLGGYRLDYLKGESAIQTRMQGAKIALDQSPIQTDLHLQGYEGKGVQLTEAHIKAMGTLAQHHLELQMRGKVQDKPTQMTASLAGSGVLQQRKGGAVAEYGWKGVLEHFQHQGMLPVTLLSPLSLELWKDQARLEHLRLQSGEAIVDMPYLDIQREMLQSEGSLKHFAVEPWLKLSQAWSNHKTLPVSSNLVLDGAWNIRWGATSTGEVSVKRVQGDVQIDRGYGKKALGLTKLETKARFSGNTMRMNGEFVTPMASIMLDGETHLPGLKEGIDGIVAAPFNGNLHLSVPELKRLSSFMDPNVSVAGQLKLDTQFSGTMIDPKWQGLLQGQHLAVTLFDQGIQLHDGLFTVGLSNKNIDLKQLEFRGGDGRVYADGHIQLGQNNPAIKAKLVAEHLQLYADPKRTLVLSGNADITNKNELFYIDGKFLIDRGLFDLPKNTPQLGDDVVLVESEQASAKLKWGKGQSAATKMTKNIAPHYPIYMSLLVDLGSDLRFKGGDADLRLKGSMNVHSEPQKSFTAQGSIRVSEGTYQIFGKKLSIEKGLIHFHGPLDNPNMTILAMRRGLDVEPGVEVIGTAQRPRAKLVSEPNVPDEEKLSWLLLGHGSDSSDKGQQQAIGAALGFLANSGGQQVASRIGLDEISLGSSKDVGTVAGSDQQLVHLGKALSDRFYVGYEQSLDGATTLIKATWRISKRWSLVVRTGVINSFDVLFNKRFDEADF
jgi:translocation and assembly module TamB